MHIWGSTMLTVEALHVSYGTSQAVKGLDLSVASDEVLCLLGPNGAGKTSTLRAISQLVPYSGRITFDGVDLRGCSPDSLARLGLLHVPEGRHVFSNLSVHENLQLGLAARNGRTARHDLDDVYDLFAPLTRLRNRAGWALSGGEQQMVAIGRALVGAPRMLLLDEPSLGLAPTIVRELFRALAVVSDQIPMIVVEQNTSMALRIADQALVLATGTAALRGTSAELTDRRQLIGAFLGQRDLGAAVESSENDHTPDVAPGL
jgi:branched-chain amino acid transport system ATP-binding protein